MATHFMATDSTSAYPAPTGSCLRLPAILTSQRRYLYRGALPAGGNVEMLMRRRSMNRYGITVGSLRRAVDDQLRQAVRWWLDRFHVWPVPARRRWSDRSLRTRTTPQTIEAS